MMNTGEIAIRVKERMRLRRVRSVAARLVWVTIAAVAIALFVTGLPVWLANEQAQYRTQFGFWQMKRNAAGAVVLEPEVGGQAARAGVLGGDILVSVEGQPPPSDGELTEVAVFPRGEAGTPLTFQVRTGERPAREITVVRGASDGMNLARIEVSANAFIAYMVGMELLGVTLAITVAGFVFWRRGSDLTGWLASLMLVVVFAGAISAPALALNELRPEWRYLLDVWTSIALGGLLFFLCLFPSGRFIPRWTPVLILAWLIWVIAAWFRPTLYFWRLETGPLLLAVSAWLGPGLVAQVWRYRFVSTPQERQQTKWVIWGTGLALLLGIMGQFAVSWLLPSNFLYDLFILPLSRLFQLLIPMSLAIAIWRYRLWDIDLLINRTLVYGSLTTLIIALYIVIVGGLGALFQTRANTISGLVATGIIAVLFQPLRERVQRGANRLLYGERDDPAAVLTQLAHHLETGASRQEILPNLVQTIAQTLKIPHAAILLPVSGEKLEPVATWGKPAAHVEVIPLTYQAEIIGQLVVAPRGPKEQFNRGERQLLATIGALTANTVRAVQLSSELRRSRRRIVSAREEERRRLRRDLHDGLGPQLASQILGFDAIEQLMSTNAEKAYQLLGSLRMQAQEAIIDVRRLVYDLRPPALDDLGLIGALQQSASRYETGSIRFILAVPEPLPALPAAVETAVFRIAQEAMTNVVRHSGATVCTVRLACSGSHLVLEVRDDGRGLAPDRRPGVGLHSMRERAAELSGDCTIEALPGGGTSVQARLPLEGYDE